MTDAVRTIQPVTSIALLRDRAEAVREEVDRVSFKLMTGSDDDRESREQEARRLITLAEELYERANELVKQAEELLLPDDPQLPETVE